MEANAKRDTERLKRGDIAIWSTGSAVDQFMTNMLMNLASPIYNVGFKVDPAFLGVALGVPRLWDAITDPIMGHISDNTRSRWGRRRPYIFIGALLCGVCFVLMWTPPASWSPFAIGWYFLVMSMVYYLAYTIFAVPWNAMGLELTPRYRERPRVQAYKMGVASIAGLFCGTLWWLAIKVGDGDATVGIRYVGLLFGLLLAAIGVLPAIFCRERVSVQSQEQIPFIPAFVRTMSNPDFLMLVSIYVLVLLGIFLVSSFALYINIYYVFGGDEEKASFIAMVGGWVYQGMGLVFVPVVAFLAGRLGKKTTLMIGLSMAMLAYSSSWFTYTPRAPYLQLLPLALCAPGLACAWILGSSMVADLCDVDELISGLRREGMYGAVYGWIVKTGLCGTMVINGALLKWSGFDAALEGPQPVEVLTRMRLMYALMPIVFLSAAIYLTYRYRVTERFMEGIRQQLESKGGSLLDDERVL